jgi:hypothetical protein
MRMRIRSLLMPATRRSLRFDSTPTPEEVLAVPDITRESKTVLGQARTVNRIIAVDFPFSRSQSFSLG